MFTLVAYVNPISNLDGIIKCQGKSHFEADSNNNLIEGVIWPEMPPLHEVLPWKLDTDFFINV